MSEKQGVGSVRIIYSIIPKGKPYLIGGGGYFVPVFDNTDHFHFACGKCEEIAEVIMVRRYDKYARTPTIYFYLRCPKCRNEGQRKIYLEDRGKHFLQISTQTKLLAKSPKEAKPGLHLG